jgi:hypothetical protein
MDTHLDSLTNILLISSCKRLDSRARQVFQDRNKFASMAYAVQIK